jgi:hypothetical protein
MDVARADSCTRSKSSQGQNLLCASFPALKRASAPEQKLPSLSL